MTDTSLLGPWVRRFLLEHLVGERNLARNTQQSYRDALRLLLPFSASRLITFESSCKSWKRRVSVMWRPVTSAWQRFIRWPISSGYVAQNTLAGVVRSEPFCSSGHQRTC